MTVVYKFALRPWSIFIDIHKDAQILSVGAQRSDVVIWALCDPDAPLVSRIVAGHPTGAPLPPALRRAQFVGTAQMDDGLVFHVFDGGEDAPGVADPIAPGSATASSRKRSSVPDPGKRS